MAGALPHIKQGPASYTAAGLILGGQLVRPAISGDTPPAGLAGVGVVANTNAVAQNIVGVAASDANTGQFPEGTPSLPGTWPGDGNNANQDQLLDSSILGYTVAVYNNVDINVNYSVSALFGKLLVADATAGVKPFTDGTDDPAAIVGRCTQPGGVTAGSVGRAFIRV